MTTLLIVLPLAAALVIWLLPLNDISAGALALLAALAEVGVWIQLVARYDFGQGGLQFAQQWNWFSDLHVSYHVGVYGFSVWLVGLTVVIMAAAIAYGFWTGRERTRAYLGLMLFLTGAVVGVFTAQDLLLFYAFFEAMMIPLYVLVGVWGGPGRMAATLKFVLFTMAGSLLMLASIVVYGLSQNTFDLVQIGQSSSNWIFLGFVAAFAIKAPLFPLHGWLPDAYRESSPEVASRRVDLRLVARVSRTRHPGRDRVLVSRADGTDHDRRLLGQRPWAGWFGAPDGQPRPGLKHAVPAGRNGGTANAHRRARTAWRHGARPSCSCHRAADDRRDRARGPALLGIRG